MLISSLAVKKKESKMNVTCYSIYDWAEAVVSSGFPMKSTYSEEDFLNQVNGLKNSLAEGVLDLNKHWQRAVKLASTKDGSGHKTFLSGILVAANVTATVKWWVQYGRYHFQQIDSSMSTMHRLRSMQENGSICFNKRTDARFIDLFFQLVNENADDETLAYSCPMGIELTARINTNFLQLRTMYVQRKNHKLKEWRDFCDWICSLPFSEDLIIQRKDENEKDSI